VERADARRRVLGFLGSAAASASLLAGCSSGSAGAGATCGNGGTEILAVLAVPPATGTAD
jgi:hypothetical protein